MREQFCLTVCWRSWQHDTDFRGCEVGLWLPFFEIKSNQHKFWQSKPPRQMKIFNSTKKKFFFSVTVPRVNQSYNFKGTCNLSRNLCNHVNFVFVVTTCSSVKFRRIRIPVDPSSPSSTRSPSKSTFQFTDWTVKPTLTVRLVTHIVNFTARRAWKNQLRGLRQDCRTPWTDKVIRSCF